MVKHSDNGRSNVMKPTRLPKQARARETVDRILEATARLLAERGFAGVNTNVVAEHAGLKPPAIYRYFPNKYALYFALAEKLQAELDAMLDTALRDADSISLDALVGNVVDTAGSFWTARPAFGLLWFGEWASQGDPMPLVAFGMRTVIRLAASTSRFRHLGPERELLVLSTAMQIAIAVIHMGDAVPDRRDTVLIEAKRALSSYLKEVLT
jgi:AcrR family transcriptional regulator